ncbi:MAG TPA: hypothetical protein PL041_09650 [Melioribacteraceae bacterium]|nr:hypothetical protein [Melioribacteraceae bacterium]
MKKYIFLLVVMFTFFNYSFVKAQDDEYQKWLKEEQQKIDNFMSEEDKKFKDFLEQEWKAFKMFQGVKFDEKPKVLKPPVFENDADNNKNQKPKKDEDKVTIGKVDNKTDTKKPILKENANPFKDDDNKLKESEVSKKIEESKEIGEQKSIAKTTESKLEESTKINIPVTEKTPQIIDKKPEITKNPEITDEPIKKVDENKPIPIVTKTNVDMNKNDLNAVFDYFGTEIKIAYSKDMKVTVSKNADNKSISKFWEEMSKKNLSDLLSQLSLYKTNVSLNDWGYSILLNSMAKQLYGNDRNSRYCFIWYVLNKSGYKCRIGFIDKNIVLFIPSKTKIFGIPYFTSSDTKERLYVINFDNLSGNLDGSIYTYDGDYPDAKKIVDMNIENSPKILLKEKVRTVNFKYKGTDYVINAKYNNNLVKYYEFYPYTDLSVYFNYRISDDTKNTLLNSLRPLIEGRSKPDAANILLRFVQIGFEYQTDDQQFGREKPLFIEEIMNYPACDCEDRSILYSFLVKELLGLSVIGVDYPGHVATAVKFDVDVPGDYVMYKNQKYVICDPTYINAYIGMAMPQFKDGKYENLIDIKN